MRLARRAVAESDATVRWDEVRSLRLSAEPWYEEPLPALVRHRSCRARSATSNANITSHGP